MFGSGGWTGTKIALHWICIKLPELIGTFPWEKEIILVLGWCIIHERHYPLLLAICLSGHIMDPVDLPFPGLSELLPISKDTGIVVELFNVKF